MNGVMEDKERKLSYVKTRLKLPFNIDFLIPLSLSSKDRRIKSYIFDD
jgi:hypothetical protein